MTPPGRSGPTRESGVVMLVDSLIVLRRLLRVPQREACIDLAREAAQILIAHQSFSACVIQLYSPAERGKVDQAPRCTVSLPNPHLVQISGVYLDQVRAAGCVQIEHDLSRVSPEQHGTLIAMPIGSGEHVRGAVAAWNPQAFTFRQWHENLLGLFADVLGLLVRDCATSAAATSSPPVAASGHPAATSTGATLQSVDDRVDAKTGLMNRNAFEDHLQQRLETHSVKSQQAFLLYVDIDRFRLIREIGGDAVADRVVKTLAALLSEQLSDAPALARLGGDQFCGVLPHSTLAHAERCAQTIVDHVELMRIVYGGERHSISVSIGVSALGGDSWSATEALQQAREACRAAQRQGGSLVHVYSESIASRQRILDDGRMLNELGCALKEDGLVLYAQPIVPVTAKPMRERSAVERFEILLRIQDRRGNVYSAGAFLPVAERYGLSVKLDRWVVSEAFRMLAALPAPPGQTRQYAINLSGHSIDDEGFLDFVVSQFKSAHLAPDCVCFELTETAAIADVAAARRFVEVLRGIGCRFALDDFGSGHSSFLHLRDLSIDVLKIEGNLVRAMIDDPVSRAIVRSINDIGKVMGKQTVAEYVESAQLAELLSDIGVDFIQGYWVGKPFPLEDLLS